MRRLAKQVKQFRFYGLNNPKNSNELSDNTAIDLLVKNNIFNDYNEILQLGIQSLPGTEFQLNESDYSIVVGNTGIYELNVAGIADITNIRFAPQSIQAIEKSSTAYLIIDILYDDGE